jgi:hypothetical protein
MSDVVLSTTESVTTVTVVDDVVQVAVTTNPVEVSSSTAGVQGASYTKGDPIYVTVTNKTGATLPKGSIVYTSGANGTHTQVSLALATSDATSARALGWLSESIANNADGLCMVEGYLDGVDTQGVTEGAQLYLSGTVPGGFQQTKPVAPIHLVYVGVAAKASAGNGRVYVKVQNGYELGELHDVLITSPTNNQVLAYDSATQLWKNAVNAPDGVTSITAVAPLTGGTITSTGSIGLDQTALSITRSQVSDFTSGTVTSASTAQQAGTAVYAVNSGTAVYATTSGTAVTISGDITKSQVSDFTSGTVASASTAQQAGTATFATTSGTATFATNSGTAVFATNAGTAVGVSGSAITQSQVVNLVSDLAGKANLAGGNAFTGAQTVTSSATGQIPVTITGATGQTGNLFSVRSDASELAFFSAAGNLNVFQQVRVGGSSGLGQLSVTSINAANIGAVIRGASGQSANLFEIQSSAGTILSRFSSSGQFVSDQQTFVGSGAASIANSRLNVATGSSSVLGLTIRGASAQTADLFLLQNNGGTTQFRVDPNGMTIANSLGVAGSPSGISYAYFTTPVAGAVPVVIRGAASQTADLLDIQNSSAVDLFSVAASGQITAKVVANAGNQNRGLMLSNTSDGWQSGLYLRSDAGGNPRLSLLAPTGALGEAVSIDAATKVGFNFIDPPAQISVQPLLPGRVGALVRGVASQTANLQEWQNSAGTLVARVEPSGKIVGGQNITSLGSVHSFNLGTFGTNETQLGSATVSVGTRAAGNIGAVVRGVSGQTANLQEWQNDAGSILARVVSDGAIRTGTGFFGLQFATLSDFASLRENNSGGRLQLVRQTAADSNPGANNARIYLRDGTNAGTLKLVVRAGAAGAETTILDNIPQ